jgi:hypothetical protein
MRKTVFYLWNWSSSKYVECRRLGALVRYAPWFGSQFLVRFLLPHPLPPCFALATRCHSLPFIALVNPTRTPPFL